jgi:glycosyltransferase involved in cell wall biosynthesis
MAETNVSVIIPVFNEEKTIGKIVWQIKELYPDFEIIVVNDGSKDQTASVAQDAGATVISHPYNIGNGAAIKNGIRSASGDVLVFMDGDAQHNPEDIGTLLTHFPSYDMVVGARSLQGQSSFGRAFGNKMYNLLASYVAKFAIKDLTSGFRAVKAPIARKFLYLVPNTYSYPTTLTLGVLRNGWSVNYIPIRTNKRITGGSNIKIFRDGVRFLMIIIKICTLYSPLRIFLPVSFTMFIIGMAHYLYTYIAHERFTNMSALMLTTSIVIFMMGLLSEQVCQMRFERSENEDGLK